MNFDGTIRGLIHRYQTNPVSGYQDIRYGTRRSYDANCRRIDWDYGDTPLSAINFEKLLTWRKAWTAASGVTATHGFFAQLRILMTFGMTILEDRDCAAISALLGKLRVQNGKPREQIITAEQVDAIRAMAHQMGRPSIALEMACQFEFALRQKDLIGEWVPESEPGDSDVRARFRVRGVLTDMKWLRGLLWPEIDGNMILRHVTSKKLKMVVFDLHESPMVMEELARLTVRPLTGPIIINEDTGLPYLAHVFRYEWRKIADAAGIPPEVQNRDTRAGAITEATDADASLDDTKHMATHSQSSQTADYSRNTAKKIKKVQRIRVASRAQKPAAESA